MLGRRVASFLLLANLCSTALSAIPWNEGDGGKVSWSLDCEFWSSTDIESLAIAPEVCGLECYNNAQCTHFTHKNGHCFLRKIEISSVSDGIPAKSPGSMCGFIRSRVPQPVPTSYDFSSDMNCLCRPKGTQSDVQTLKTQNDGRIVSLNWSSDGQYSQGGTTTWAEDCDFIGYDLPNGEFRNEVADNCPKLCLARKECTNFTFNKTTKRCYLKNIPSADPVPLGGWTGTVCGYNRSRYSPQFLKSGLGTPNWQCICRPL